MDCVVWIFVWQNKMTLPNCKSLKQNLTLANSKFSSQAVLYDKKICIHFTLTLSAPIGFTLWPDPIQN
jgi:hypothetical protein